MAAAGGCALADLTCVAVAPLRSARPASARVGATVVTAGAPMHAVCDFVNRSVFCCGAASVVASTAWAWPWRGAAVAVTGSELKVICFFLRTFCFTLLVAFSSGCV